MEKIRLFYGRLLGTFMNALLSYYKDVTWVSWRHKRSAIRLFLEQIFNANKKNPGNIKWPHYLFLRGEYTGHRWILFPKGHLCGKRSHVSTPSWYSSGSICVIRIFVAEFSVGYFVTAHSRKFVNMLMCGDTRGASMACIVWHCPTRINPH